MLNALPATFAALFLFSRHIEAVDGSDVQVFNGLAKAEKPFNFLLQTAEPSAISVVVISTVDVEASQITAAAILEPRNPQNQNDCAASLASASSQAASSASRSASGVIQQATQSAQQAIDSASRSADQAAQQASQQASRAQQSASQAAADAQRSIQSISSSASSAISRAEESARSASDSASAAQSSANSAQSEASRAILQAGAAVAAATGSAAAAGSSFLRAAASATAQAAASAAAAGEAANIQISAASQQATASQNAAVTATQAALAIVGSVIASSLISILLYFLISRHKSKQEKKKEKKRETRSSYGSLPDKKSEEFSRQATAVAESSGGLQSDIFNKETMPDSSRNTMSLYPTPRQSKASSETQRKSALKSTTAPWSPPNPRAAPSSQSWITSQPNTSPLGPIDLPRSATPSPTPAPAQASTQPQLQIQTPKPTIPVLTSPTNILPTKDFQRPFFATTTNLTPSSPTPQNTLTSQNNNLTLPRSDRDSDLRVSYSRESNIFVETAIPQAIAYPEPVRTVTQAPKPRNTKDWLAERRKRLEAARASGLPRNPGGGLPGGPRLRKE